MFSINLDGLNEKVSPEIKNTKKYLENARYILEKISAPEDFNYSVDLRSINTQIIGIEDEIYAIDKWLETSIVNFNEAQERTKTMLDSIFGGITLQEENIKATVQTSHSILEEIETVDSRSRRSMVGSSNNNRWNSGKFNSHNNRWPTLGLVLWKM